MGFESLARPEEIGNDELSFRPKFIIPCGDNGVGGARLLLFDELLDEHAVKAGAEMLAWPMSCSISYVHWSGDLCADSIPPDLCTLLLLPRTPFEFKQAEAERRM